MNSRSRIPILLVAWGILLAAPPRTQSFAKPEFESAPEPDRSALFKLMMTTAGERIDNETFAWQHLLLFGPRDAECAALARQMRNEISRRKILAEAQAVFRRDLTAAAGWPPSAVFRLQSLERLGEYHFDTGAFPIQPSLSGTSIIRADQELKMAPAQGLAGQSGYYGGPVPPTSCLSTTMLTLDGRPFGSPMQTVLALKLKGNDKIRQLPVSRPEAEALLEGRLGRSRRIRIELLAETGTPDAELSTRVFTIPARVIAARAVNPDTGTVVHTYDPPLFAR